MRHGSKVAMLFALALSAAPFAVSAHPAILANGLAGQAAAPIVKAGCYYGECDEEVYIRRRCWYSGCGDWRPRRSGYNDDYYHSRYYSHYRRGSYHRYWRPYWCCGSSGWGD